MDDLSQVSESVPEIEAFLSQLFSYQQAHEGEKEAKVDGAEIEGERRLTEPAIDASPSHPEA